MRNLFYLLLVSIIFFSSNPVKSQEKAVKIVVLGSSTAAGSGPTNSSNAWVNRYRRYVQSINSQNQVTNLAVGGYTTYRIMPTGYTPPSGRHTVNITHNITAALGYSPDAIVINLPSNDAANGYTVEEQIRNYDTIMAKANEQKIPVWVCTTQPRNMDNAKRQNLMDMRDSTYTLFGDMAVDFWTDLAREWGFVSYDYDSGDGVHLNDTAHGILCQRVIDAKIIEFLSEDYLQAEDYWSIADGERDSSYRGNSGDGFVRFQKKVGVKATWKLKATEATSLMLAFRYANNDSASKSCVISVNGTAQGTLEFSSTKSLSIWNQEEIELQLSAGDNIVEIQSLTTDGIPNLDYLSWDDSFVTYEKGTSTSHIDINSPQIEIYPNPTSDRLFIRNASGKLMLSSAQGSVIQTYDVIKGEACLDISRLSKGLYILSYTTEDGLVRSTKVIKE